MSGDRTAAILGLGLIGGSLARDLDAAGVRVLGWDRDAATLRSAIASGVVRRGLAADLGDIDEADWLIVAVPPGSVGGVLADVSAAIRSGSGRRLRLVMDVGSTKRRVMAAATDLGALFVGSHPLAGDHASGWEASRERLFDGARVYLCPVDGVGGTAFSEACSLWSLCGGRPSPIGAAEHDRLLARTSHLPQLLSTALAVTLAAEGIDPAEAGPGARGILRLAGSSPDMWAGIVTDNRAEILDAVITLQRILADARHLLEHRDDDGIRSLLETGRRYVTGDGLPTGRP